jgi:hypothetical protein
MDEANRFHSILVEILRLISTGRSFCTTTTTEQP